NTALVVVAGFVAVAVHGQTCEPGTGVLTQTGTGNACCKASTIYNDDADSCNPSVDSNGNAIFVCQYLSQTYEGDSAYAFRWPSSISSLDVEVVGANGNPARGDAGQLGGLTQVVKGTLSTAGFTDNTAYIYVNYGGALARGYVNSAAGGSGGGFSSIGSDTTFATADSGTPDGRLVVSGGGGGGGGLGPGGNAGSPNGADGTDSNPIARNSDGHGGTQTVGGAATGNPPPFMYNGGDPGIPTTGDFTATLASTINIPRVIVSYLAPAPICVPAVGMPPLGGSGAVTRQRRRALEARQQRRLTFSPADVACPASQRACPLPSGNFECIDFDELSSCGGCVSDNSGVDCLSLKGVNGVGCIENKCVAW
ncbi:hypothetical protein MNV49_002231, partial [Pseudohyphozyma bogoriensis]